MIRRKSYGLVMSKRRQVGAVPMWMIIALGLLGGLGSVLVHHASGNACLGSGLAARIAGIYRAALSLARWPRAVAGDRQAAPGSALPNGALSPRRQCGPAVEGPSSRRIRRFQGKGRVASEKPPSKAVFCPAARIAVCVLRARPFFGVWPAVPACSAPRRSSCRHRSRRRPECRV
jgi:hypothetical protein